ncbi:hypothetical protein D3C87_1366180 [compost metagenome]
MHTRVTEPHQLFKHTIPHQTATKQIPGLAVTEQNLPVGVTDQGGYRQILEPVGDETVRISRPTHGLLKRHDLLLQAIPAREVSTPTLRKHFRFAVQSRQLPAKIRQHHAEPPPVPDQIR